MKVEICPVCKGTGKYIVVKYRKPFELYQFTVSPIEYYNETICHGCAGRGWIFVPDEISFDFDKIT